jgi:predicted RNase H-like HicB family nuclease
MNRAYTAVIKQDEGWWIGWIQEVPGVNSQGLTRDELLSNSSIGAEGGIGNEHWPSQSPWCQPRAVES